MKYLKSFENYQTYSLLEDDNINFYFDYIFEQSPSLGKFIGKLFKANKKDPNLLRKVYKNLKVTPKEPPKKTSLNLSKTSSSRPPKASWDYQKVNIGDDLVLVNNPKGRKDISGAHIKEIYKTSNKDQYVHLKIADGEFGKHYYMSAKMDNPVEAGKAYKKLLEFIPKGSYFGEPRTGSLSTDSFYNVFKRIKSGQFEFEIKGYMKLNSQGKKRYRESIKNPILGTHHNDPLYFKTKQEAIKLRDALNKDLKSLNDKDMKLSKLGWDKEAKMFYIQIPRIFLKIK